MRVSFSQDHQGTVAAIRATQKSGLFVTTDSGERVINMEAGDRIAIRRDGSIAAEYRRGFPALEDKRELDR